MLNQLNTNEKIGKIVKKKKLPINSSTPTIYTLKTITSH